MIFHHFHSLRLFLTAVMAVALYGCAPLPPVKLYQPGLDESKIATIHRVAICKKGKGVALVGIFPIPIKLRHKTWVMEVDGRSIKTASTTFDQPDIVLVGAGLHTVKLFYERDRIFQLCGYGYCSKFLRDDLSTSFFAEGKHEYRFFAYIPDEREWVWVEDETTGKIVTGEKPPDIESYVTEPEPD